MGRGERERVQGLSHDIETGSTKLAKFCKNFGHPNGDHNILRFQP